MAPAALPESSTTPEARAIFEDAAAAHRAAVPLSDGAASYHEEPAATIELILEGGNSRRRARDPARRPIPFSAVDGWKILATKPVEQTIDLAAQPDNVIPPEGPSHRMPA